MLENQKKYFSISQFANIYNLNKKTLIYYDEINLFKPAIIKSNGYRYYTIHQIPLFEVILFLKQVGMPLKKIKNYIDKRSKEELYIILKEHKKIIENQILELKSINSIINTKLDILEKYKNIQNNKIFIEYIEEEYLILSPNIKNLEENLATKLMWEHMAYTYNNKLHKGYGIGAMINVNQLFKNDFTNYSYYYTKLDKKPKNIDFYLKEKGEYLVGYFNGDWKNFDIFYKEILEYINKNDIKITGYSYEETIFDETSEKNFDTYLTKFMLKII